MCISYIYINTGSRGWHPYMPALHFVLSADTSDKGFLCPAAIYKTIYKAIWDLFVLKNISFI